MKLVPATPSSSWAESCHFEFPLKNMIKSQHSTIKAHIQINDSLQVNSKLSCINRLPVEKHADDDVGFRYNIWFYFLFDLNVTKMT